LAIGAVVVTAHSPRAEAQPAALRAGGHATVANSKAGSAILAGRLGPGDSISGTVMVANMGRAAGDFTLAASHLVDVPGTQDRPLSARLDLAVNDVTRPGAPVSVYRGRLGSLPPTALGSFRPYSIRIYRFTVTWADGGAVDSAYAGASMSVRFDWSAEGPGHGGGMAPPAASPPRARLPGLDFRFRAPKRQRVTRRQRMLTRARCSEACTVKMTTRMATRGSSHALVVRWTSRTLAAGATTRLQVSLPRVLERRLRHALRTHRHPLLKLTATASGVTGSSRTAQRRVRVVG
jgi:hypothetical protein